MTGTSCIVVGFSFANEAGCKGSYLQPTKIGLNEVTGLTVSTLLPISLGFAVLLCGGIYEKYTTRECLFPPTTFTDPTTGTKPSIARRDTIFTCGSTVIILVISFLHQVTFTSGTFYLSLFYQVMHWI